MSPPDISPTASPSSSWSDLLPDLLGLVLTRLPLPADCARFRAVCRGWHSAARLHVRQLPWVVFPNGSFGTIGHGGGFYFPEAIPGLPKNVTCIGAATVGWLVLDYTDDDKFSDNCVLEPRRDVKNRHSYRLYNPFSGKILLLPDLDSIMEVVALMEEMAKTFEIRKVLMRCPSPSSNSPHDELIAITTNNCNCNVIFCRPGKMGSYVLANVDIFDVAFHGDKLYGITSKEELVAWDLAEDVKGTPIVTKCRRVIKRVLGDGEEDHQSWTYDDISYDDSDGSIDGELEEEAEDHEEEEKEEEEEEEEEDNDNGEEDNFNGDDLVLSGMDMWFNAVDKQNPYDIFTTTRHLVQSSCGDGDDEKLFMVRHHTRSSRTIGVDILKADVEAGNWAPVSELAEGKALFLSRSFSTSTRVYGDIQEGFIYSTYAKDVFDTKSGNCSLLRLPRQWEGADHELLTWLFPPKLHL